jgi:hypothetical protein
MVGWKAKEAEMRVEAEVVAGTGLSNLPGSRTSEKESSGAI